jgi:hypothetical protein
MTRFTCQWSSPSAVLERSSGEGDSLFSEVNFAICPSFCVLGACGCNIAPGRLPLSKGSSQFASISLQSTAGRSFHCVRAHARVGPMRQHLHPTAKDLNLPSSVCPNRYETIRLSPLIPSNFYYSQSFHL